MPTCFLPLILNVTSEIPNEPTFAAAAHTLSFKPLGGNFYLNPAPSNPDPVARCTYVLHVILRTLVCCVVWPALRVSSAAMLPIRVCSTKTNKRAAGPVGFNEDM